MLQNEVLVTAAITIVVLLVVLALVHVANRIARNYLDEPHRLYQTSRTIRRIGAVVAVVAVTLLLSPEAGDLLTVLTVIGAGLAIAMREVVLSAAGWLKIVSLTSYRHGDRIEINGVRGDVIDIRGLRTTLLEIGSWVDADQSTGRIVHFPNNWVFSHEIYNYTRGFRFIWNELPVTVTFRSDWEEAREILSSFADETARIVEQQAAGEIREMSKEFLIHYSILTPFVYVRLVPNGVRLTLRYLCEAQKRRGTEHALTMSILDAFNRHPDIEFAFPALEVTRSDLRSLGGEA